MGANEGYMGRMLSILFDRPDKTTLPYQDSLLRGGKMERQKETKIDAGKLGTVIYFK